MKSEIDSALKGLDILARGIAPGGHDGERIKPCKGDTSPQKVVIER